METEGELFTKAIITKYDDVIDVWGGYKGHFEVYEDQGDVDRDDWCFSGIGGPIG